MATSFISLDNLAGLVGDLRSEGTTVVAPSRVDARGVEYRPVDHLGEAALGDGIPGRSLKELFLPPTEVLFSWSQGAREVRIAEVPTEFPPSVVLGARPCDAAGTAKLDRLMDWDYRDELWFGRRAAATIVSLACTDPDSSCFCSTVGLGPDDAVGSDVMLFESNGGYVAEAVTDKGRAFVDAHPARFVSSNGLARPEDAVAESRRRVAANLAVSARNVGEWLARNFEHPMWNGIALRCNGCGACAAVCPTCHCFDIVDEPDGVAHGVRRRNWDTCQTARFTLHASGHNPRADQRARQRQRLMHKFHIFPARFGEVLCTGCGRCARACPAGQDILQNLAVIDELAGRNAEAAV